MSNEKQSKELAYYIVSPDTGEISNEIYVGDSIIRKETSEYLARTEKIGDKMSFIKLFRGLPLENLVHEKLTPAQWGTMMLFANLIRYESGLVALPNGTPITADDVADFLDISRRSVFDAIEKLIEKKIIAKAKTGISEVKYYVNPFIFTTSVRVNKTLLSMFKDTKWESYHFEEREKKARRLLP